MDYTGCVHIYLKTEQEAADYYADKEAKILSLVSEIYINQYFIIHYNDAVIDYFKYTQSGLVEVRFGQIDSKFTGKVKPRNPEQVAAVDLLKDRDVPVKLITGKFGTGKTFLCVTAALEAVEKNKFDKIIFVRNNVQVKDTTDLGALPGDEIDKTLPYIMPFADHCGGIEGLKYLIDKDVIEVIPLAFLRGRSIKNAILYSMESENLTKEHIQLILGRIDKGSELWLDGDIKQRDKSAFDKSKGLEKMIERLAGNNLFGYVHLQKSERSEVAALADLLD